MESKRNGKKRGGKGRTNDPRLTQFHPPESPRRNLNVPVTKFLSCFLVHARVYANARATVHRRQTGVSPSLCLVSRSPRPPSAPSCASLVIIEGRDEASAAPVTRACTHTRARARDRGSLVCLPSTALPCERTAPASPRFPFILPPLPPPPPPSPFPPPAPSPSLISVTLAYLCILRPLAGLASIRPRHLLSSLSAGPDLRRSRAVVTISLPIVGCVSVPLSTRPLAIPILVPPLPYLPPAL